MKSNKLDLDKKFVIAISRDIASGGTHIAKELAERLNIKFINKEKLGIISKKLGISEEQVKDIKHKNVSWWDDVCKYYNTVTALSVHTYEDRYEMNSRTIIQAESKILKEFAEHESIITIGRAGHLTFKDAPNSLHIFLSCDKEQRIANLMNKEGVDAISAQKKIEEADKRRAAYCKQNFDEERYDLHNYDLVLNITDNNVERTVQTILAYIRN